MVSEFLSCAQCKISAEMVNIKMTGTSHYKKKKKKAFYFKTKCKKRAFLHPVKVEEANCFLLPQRRTHALPLLSVFLSFVAAQLRVQGLRRPVLRGLGRWSHYLLQAQAEFLWITRKNADKSGLITCRGETSHPQENTKRWVRLLTREREKQPCEKCTLNTFGGAQKEEGRKNPDLSKDHNQGTN